MCCYILLVCLLLVVGFVFVVVFSGLFNVGLNECWFIMVVVCLDFCLACCRLCFSVDGC